MTFNKDLNYANEKKYIKKRLLKLYNSRCFTVHQSIICTK